MPTENYCPICRHAHDAGERCPYLNYGIVAFAMGTAAEIIERLEEPMPTIPASPDIPDGSSAASPWED